MKPENILKTDFLDILFNNKNKEYGAYQLRKTYNQRVKKSLLITSSLVLLFAGLQGWRSTKKTQFVIVGEMDTYIDPFKPEEKKIEPEIEKPKQRQQEEVKQEKFTSIIDIVKTPITGVPNIDSLKNANLGTTKLEGTETTGSINHVAGTPQEGSTDTKIPITPSTNTLAIDDNKIFIEVEQMPEFIGGSDAMRRFLLRNLPQPDDLEEGQKIIVYVRFVVDKEGNISASEIVQSGREDLDEAVLKVVNKMPKWKPGFQNGVAVPVYFTLPVSFVNNQ